MGNKPLERFGNLQGDGAVKNKNGKECCSQANTRMMFGKTLERAEERTAPKPQADVHITILILLRGT